MDEIQVNTWEECEEQVRAIRQKYPHTEAKVVFRGQSHSEWPLSTTLERYDNRPYRFLDYYKLALKVKHDVETMSEATWEFPKFQELSDWTKRDDISHYEVLAYPYLAHLRHNGFPSPLLDWSYSLHVASFFAFSGARDSDGNVAIYAFLETPEGIKVGGSGIPAIRMPGQYVKTHRRHFRQQSRYTVCAIFDQDEFDGTYSWRFEPHQAAFHTKAIPTEQDLLWKITIPAVERQKVLRRLDEFNLNAYSPFDSEESLMETLAFREIDLNLPHI